MCRAFPRNTGPVWVQWLSDGYRQPATFLETRQGDELSIKVTKVRYCYSAIDPVNLPLRLPKTSAGGTNAEGTASMQYMRAEGKPPLLKFSALRLEPSQHRRTFPILVTLLCWCADRRHGIENGSKIQHRHLRNDEAQERKRSSQEIERIKHAPQIDTVNKVWLAHTMHPYPASLVQLFIPPTPLLRERGHDFYFVQDLVTRKLRRSAARARTGLRIGFDVDPAGRDERQSATWRARAMSVNGVADRDAHRHRLDGCDGRPQAGTVPFRHRLGTEILTAAYRLNARTCSRSTAKANGFASCMIDEKYGKPRYSPKPLKWTLIDSIELTGYFRESSMLSLPRSGFFY
ncbi:hypothetical protein C8R45DRAFT_928736 [Mycena sanguinolenta]|nr:hypothetical protein C8R45DRAFT_928736 [Mycena sanguinolenta]